MYNGISDTTQNESETDDQNQKIQETFLPLATPRPSAILSSHECVVPGSYLPGVWTEIANLREIEIRRFRDPVERCYQSASI